MKAYAQSSLYFAFVVFTKETRIVLGSPQDAQDLQDVTGHTVEN